MVEKELWRELPKSWVKVCLDEISELCNGINFKKDQKGKEGILTIDVLNMYSDSIYIDFRSLYRVDKKVTAERLLKYGDILFVRSSVKREGVGWATAFKELINEPVTFCGFIIRARLKSKELLPEYFTYYLRSYNTREIIIGSSSQVTITNINQNALGKVPLPLPPLPEQHRIVAKIEELFSELDNGIENLKKAREQLKTYRQAVLKYAFEGKLTKGSAKAKNVKIKDLFTLIDGDRGRNYPKKDDYLQKGFCLFLSTKNVRFGKFEFHETVFISEKKHNELRSGIIKRGDIVITTRGTIGNVAFYDERIPYDVVRINSGMLILRAKLDKVYKKYFLHYVGSPTFWNQIQKKRSGTAQPQLPAGVLKEFDIPLFAKGIQRNIVQEIESRLSVCDQLEQTIEDSLKKAEALRQSILKKAFEGELTKDWREKHPELIAGENSAEKLLKKIKAEKAMSAAGRKKQRSRKTKKR